MTTSPPQTDNPPAVASGRGPDAVRFTAAALIVLLSTRQVYAVYALKGLSPAQVALILTGALGAYWVLSGHRLTLGARGLSVAILASLLTTVVSFNVVTTRVLPHLALIQAGQGIAAFAVTVTALMGFVFLFAAHPESSARTIEILLKALVIGGAITAALALVQFATGLDVAAMIRIPGIMKFGDTGVAHGIVREGVVRAQGAAAHALELSAVLTTIAPIGVALVYSAKAAGRRTWPWALLTIVVIAGSVVTVSRSAFIGLAAAILVMSWRWPVARLAGLLCAAVGAAAVAAVSGLGVFDAIISTFMGSADDPSLQSRARGIDYVMSHWTEHFWLGQGSFTYPLGAEQPVLDNEYLSRLIEGGILGLLSLVVLMITAIIYAAGARNRCRDAPTTELINGVLGGLVALTVVGSVLDVSAFQQISMIRWLLIVLAGGAWALVRRDQEVAT
ncbi:MULTISPECIES: O-antigen ligase family protein [unclassified Mycobacterium]|uniref:O-antigen ligase family protein n=1 Tax=unclassified Mycobacterium TaxID=2642494 RepID=UPI000992EFAE|nr:MULTISPECIES: O-antigen ligase family protein [unclassified Mycobacterium]